MFCARVLLTTSNLCRLHLRRLIARPGRRIRRIWRGPWLRGGTGVGAGAVLVLRPLARPARCGNNDHRGPQGGNSSAGGPPGWGRGCVAAGSALSWAPVRAARGPAGGDGRRGARPLAP
eukprot:8242013-Pyramimonas_sp.AAC.2